MKVHYLEPTRSKYFDPDVYRYDAILSVSKEEVFRLIMALKCFCRDGLEDEMLIVLEKFVEENALNEK